MCTPISLLTVITYATLWKWKYIEWLCREKHRLEPLLYKIQCSVASSKNINPVFNTNNTEIMVWFID